MSIPRSIRVILLSLTTLLLLWNCQTDMSPVARDDTAATDRNMPVTITVVANDTASTGHIVASTVAVIAGPGHGTAHVQADGTVTYTPATDFVGSDSLSYVVTDSAGETSNTAMVTVTVRAVNRAPVANAGPENNAMTGRSVMLDGTQSFDPDHDLLTYAWQFVAVPPTSAVTTASLANAQTAAPSFTPDVDGTYVLELTVSDGTLSSTDRVQVTAMGLPNVHPNANAGQPQTAQVGTVVRLDGRGSQDPDNGPQPLSFQWSFLAVPPGSTLTSADLQGAATPLATFTPDMVGVYRVDLQVSDGRDTSQTEVQITVTPSNVAPNADAGLHMVVQLGDTVTLHGTASHDPDNGPQPLTYQWTLVSKPAASGLTNASIQDVTTATPSLTPDVAGIYVLQLEVSDGALSDFAQVRLIANVAPVAVDDTYDVDQDQTLTVPAPGVPGVLDNDTDGNNDPLTVVLGNTVSHGTLTLNVDGSFMYTPTTGFSGTDSFTYQASDGSVDSNMAAVTVNVTQPNVNQAPVVNPATFTIAENSANGTVVGKVTFTDPDMGQSHTLTISAGNAGGTFALNVKTGQLTVANSAALNFETTPSFSLTVQVTDNGTPVKSGSAIITINLTNVNEAPVVNTATFTVPENSANGMVVGTVTSTDPDAGQSGIFAISAGNTGGAFAVNASTGQLTVANSTALNIGTTPSFSLTVQVTDNGTPVKSGSAIIMINLTNVNHAPSFTVGPNQMVNEDAGPQTVIGWATAISAGPANESGQTLTFNITSNTNPALFSAGPAVSSAGGLTYTPAANANGTATITVTLSDNGGTANGGVDTSAPQTFSITVNPVNDAPSFTVGPNQTVLDDAGPQSVANWATGISAGPIDEAGQTLMFHVTNNTNASLFAAGPAVSSSGLLTYTPAVNANGTATITLVLQDNGGVNTSLPQTFTITVTAVNDPPTANGFTNLPAQAGIPITYPAGKLGGTDVESGTTVTIETTPDGMTGGAVTINADGSFVFTPLPSTAGGMAQFTYHVCDNGAPGPGLCSSPATVSFSVAGPAIYFVKNSAVDAGNCTLGNECTLTTALTNIGTVMDTKIFIGDSGTYSNTVTLNSSGWLIGQGVTGMTFDTLFGISVPAQGVLAERPSLGGNQPTPTIQGTVTLATDSAVRGLSISTSSATGLSGSAASGVTVSEVDVTTESATVVHLTNTDGTILNNNITMRNVVANTHTILITFSGTGSSSALLISGNKVTHNGVQDSDGIHVDILNANPIPNFSVTVTNNDVTALNGRNAISLNAEQSSMACFYVLSNKTVAPNGIGILVRRRPSSTVRLGPGDPLSGLAASVVLSANNPEATGDPMSDSDTVVNGAVAALVATCPTPSSP